MKKFQFLCTVKAFYELGGSYEVLEYGGMIKKREYYKVKLQFESMQAYATLRKLPNGTLQLGDVVEGEGVSEEEADELYIAVNKAFVKSAAKGQSTAGVLLDRIADTISLIRVAIIVFAGIFAGKCFYVFELRYIVLCVVAVILAVCLNVLKKKIHEGEFDELVEGGLLSWKNQT